MNPYTSLWTGVTPGDGPQEFHLVLLDAGRTATLADPVGRDALRCIRCSACLNVCPVYERVGGHAYDSTYPGPIGAILTPQLHELREGTTLPWASSLCGACYEVCPVKIDIPSILIHLRGRVVRERGAPAGERMAMAALARVFAHRRRYEAAQRAARTASRPLSRDGRIERRLPGPMRGWLAVRDLPVPPKRDVPRVVGARARVSARDEILGRVRAALAAHPVAVDELPEPAARPAPPVPDVDLFCERASDYRAHVTTVAAADDSAVREAIEAACERHAVARLGVPADLDAAWRPRGVTIDELGDDPPLDVLQARRRRAHHLRAARSPRPAPCSSTAGPARGRALRRSSPTATSAWSPVPSSSTTSVPPSPESGPPCAQQRVR